MELRQPRSFVTLAEELHFGRAADREHIVQSALSQQVQRLERELGVRLLERSTHHVALTASGAVFLVEARQILAHVDRAAHAARSTAGPPPPRAPTASGAGFLVEARQILAPVDRAAPAARSPAGASAPLRVSLIDS